MITDISIDIILFALTTRLCGLHSPNTRYLPDVFFQEFGCVPLRASIPTSGTFNVTAVVHTRRAPARSDDEFEPSYRPVDWNESM